MAENEERVLVKELRERSDAELASLRDAKTEELHRASFNHALGQLQTTHVLKALKRDIARINTVLRQRQPSEAQS